jgi:hypothetical protein
MTNKTKKKNSKKHVKTKVVRTIMRRRLDEAAARYAQLMADPCNAPLVHPVYPGPDAGFLFRAESFATHGTVAGETAGFLHWTPGYVNFNGSELVGGGAATAATAVTVAGLAGQPGKSFLTANAKGLRCVAACLKVSFPGAETARAGRIHYGHTTAGMMDLGLSTAPDNVAQTLQHYGRTPTDIIEIVWRPNVADTEFNDPGEGASAVIRDRKSSITVAWAGLPAAVGLTFHFTAVYEWTPAVGLGIGHNSLGMARSSNSLDEVVTTLRDTGFRFVRNFGAGVAHVGGNMGGVAAMAAMQSAFGLMPAFGRSRTRQQFLV